MAFGSFDSGVSRPMAEINTTPLVDVMLVLLIIFLVTAPLMTSSIKVDLPRTPSPTSTPEPPEEPLRLSLDSAGTLYWNDEALTETGETGLEARLTAAVNVNPQLEVHLAADRNTRYERIADLMATARRAGVAKMGFVSTPKPAGESPMSSADDGPRPDDGARPDGRGQNRHGRRHGRAVGF